MPRRALATYRSKRFFERTAEPRGGRAAGSGHSFVVQKHDASRLHYDFRLELDGVLLSWAVPKGPSLDPKVKRLAVETEAHPVEYGSFEGTIPEGEYGAGTVMLWDQGTWEPDTDPNEQYEKGRLSFELHGERMKGKWHLVRSRSTQGGKRGWLLFKGRDELASDRGEALVEENQTSVKSGRSMDEIEAGRRAVARKIRKKLPARAEVKEVALTNPDKILYPEQGVTKRELALHYALVAELMLPHVADRPLMLLRCPDGRHKQCFFFKHPTQGMPEGVREVTIEERGGPARYAAIDDVEGLVGLVQLGGLEIHTWGSRVSDLERPDLLVFDLDPAPEVDWPRVVAGALLLHDLFAELELQSFVKTTGGKGLHVCVPLRPSLGWDEVKAFSQAVAAALERHAPEEYVATSSKAKRKGKIFVDYLRNGRGATFIAPYSTRAKEGAPVATPVAWSELERVRPEELTLRNFAQRLSGQRRDPWRDMAKLRQALTPTKIQSLGTAALSAEKRR